MSDTAIELLTELLDGIEACEDTTCGKDGTETPENPEGDSFWVCGNVNLALIGRVRAFLVAYCKAQAMAQEVESHVHCVVCRECVTCNLRPCRDGGRHRVRAL